MIAKHDDGKVITFENNNAKYGFELETGKLVSLYSKLTGWDIIKRRELAKSFKMLIPLENRRNNPAEGDKVSEVRTDENSVEFVYETVTSKFGGEHNIKVVTRFTVDEEKGYFGISVENGSDKIIENISYPIIEDLSNPEESEKLFDFSLGYSDIMKTPIYPEFTNDVGYWGSDTPIRFVLNAPHNMFHMIMNDDQGLYIGLGENTTEIAVWQLELMPGFECSMRKNTSREDEIGGKLRHIRVSCERLPYIEPGTKITLTDIVTQAYSGDWHKGADIYKGLVEKWGFKAAKPPKWASEPHSWLQIHINSPEDELRYSYSQLVEIGKECAKHGIKAIQLVGWNNGGQDRGNPSHDTDSRLGTAEELKRAIEEIRAMGVKVVLFVKFTWADRSTQWFRRELKSLAVQDPYGDYYVHPGYQYQTVAQHLDANTRRLVPMCINSEKYREICTKEFIKTLKLGADGVLYDECQHHGNGKICYAKDHGHKYGESSYNSDNKLIEEFKQFTAGNDDFIFVGEACYDKEFEQYQMAYIRSNELKFVPARRYMFPDLLYMTAVIGFNDRNMINQCLMFRYIISYEPYNFKGRPEDFPLTLEYGKKMDKLRSELREYFWDGEFLHTTVGSITDDEGKPYGDYAAYRTKSGKIGVVITNFSYKKVRLNVRFDEDFTKYKEIEDENFKMYTDTIEINPQSAAVIV